MIIFNCPQLHFTSNYQKRITRYFSDPLPSPIPNPSQLQTDEMMMRCKGKTWHRRNAER